MSLPALQSDATAGTAIWLNHVMVHTSGVSDGTGDGTWSYDSTALNRITYTSSTNTWTDVVENSAAPNTLSSTSTWVSGQKSVVNPQYVFLWYNSGDFLGKFLNPFYQSNGTSTEGVPIIQWEGSFTKNPGNDYWRWNVTGLNTDATDYIYLVDGMPAFGSTENTIGTRTFAASSSPTSQYGLFTPDVTKTYYIINYLLGSSSTNLNVEVLATKNFANKKVSCNFW